MANTYTQIHIQVVFAVQDRLCIVKDSWESELYKYLNEIVQSGGHKVLAINGMPDHVHLFFGMRPTQSLSDLMTHVKGDTSRWINDRRLTRGKFAWQSGYGAFSYSRSQVPAVIRYIQNQKTHHKKKTFMEEYHDWLRKYEIEFDERYTFQEVEY
ncbi:MAG: IS200/IS605 family transposase [Planctomycetota bacterium]|jgi:putative transposase